MYRIIGQPINVRKIGSSKLIEEEIPADWKWIVRVVEFGLKVWLQSNNGRLYNK